MPAQLMRSRYTAYALGNVEYLLQSWHVSTRPQNIALDSQRVWTGLTLLNESRVVEEMGRKTAYVEFIAHFIHAGVKGQMHERSRFLSGDGLWFYVDGEQIEGGMHYVNRVPGRNAPCYCGSGKKFKKCCGA
ncbi:UPF0225 protein YchJ [hydrothermal vent metagenome]|uniref:UPF0225 protein YchJ n=1 Tax=hydrothermal vent metagenome TaxID=652676 RepID=A0A3B0XQK6_9ZZZZ